MSLHSMDFYTGMNTRSNVLKSRTITLSDKKIRINPPEGWEEEEEEKRREEELSKTNRESAEMWAQELENLTVLKAQMIAEGQKEADRVKGIAQAESMDIVSRAVVDGNNQRNAIMEEARQAGYESGITQGRKDGELLRTQALEVLDDAQKQRAEMIAGVEGELVQLVMDISEKLLRNKAAFSPQLILCLIKAALSETTTSEDITVRVSEDDYDGVLENKEELMKMVGGGAKLEIVKDMALGKSDCVIETAYGYIDSSLDQQLSALREQIYFIGNIK